MKKLLLAATSLICSAVCAFSMSACNSGKSTLLATPASPEQLAYSQITEENFVAFKQKADGFASRFAAETYAAYDKQDNFTVSPVSMFMALSLAAECADGATRQEILSALGVSYEELIANVADLYCSLNVQSYVETYLGGKKLQSQLQLGNSIWIQDGLQYERDCVDTLAEKYFCYPYAADFANDNANANKAVRSFVKDQTNGLIDCDFELSPLTLFTLINTLYLKDVWNIYGDDLSVTQENYSFANYDGTVTETKLLNGYYSTGRAYEGDTYTSYYTTTYHNYKIKFIVPKDGYTVDEVFTAENIRTVNSVTDYNALDEENLRRYHTRCIFPEYTASYDNDVREILKEKFGITSLFDPDECNLSNLTGASGGEVACDSVRHVTTLMVDRKGIEGAAVTAIVGAGAPGPDEYTDVYVDFVVDRAFGFIVTDPYNVNLFTGVVKGI